MYVYIYYRKWESWENHKFRQTILVTMIVVDTMQQRSSWNLKTFLVIVLRYPMWSNANVDMHTLNKLKQKKSKQKCCSNCMIVFHIVMVYDALYYDFL